MNDPLTQTSPAAIVPRFCGYCGKHFNSTQGNFLMHVHDCEKKKCNEYHDKRGDKR